MAIIKCKMCGGDLNVEENSFQTFLSLPFASARESPGNRKGKELNR